MIIVRKLISFSSVLGLFFLMSTSANAYEFPPYRGITLKIIGDIAGNYSNNVTYASDEENKVEEFTTMLNLGLNFQYTGKGRSLGFSGNVKREIFQPSSDVRNPSENAILTFTNEFSPYDRISLSNTFTHTQVPGRNLGDFGVYTCRQELEDKGLPPDIIESICNEYEEEFGRFKGRFDSYSNALSLTYNKTISEYFNISTNYNYRQNWSDEEGTRDADHHSIRLNANYQYSQPTRFSLSYNYRVSMYEGSDDISRQLIDLGIRQYITKRLYFDGNIGTDRAISGSGDDSITGHATLSSEIDETMTAALTYSARTSISDNTDDTFKNWNVTGRLSKQLLEDLNAFLSAFYGKGEYSSTGVEDTLLGARIDLSYNFWRSKRGSDIRGNLGYSYLNQDSTDISRQYTRNSINSGITVAF